MRYIYYRKAFLWRRGRYGQLKRVPYYSRITRHRRSTYRTQRSISLSFRSYHQFEHGRIHTSSVRYRLYARWKYELSRERARYFHAISKYNRIFMNRYMKISRDLSQAHQHLYQFVYNSTYMNDKLPVDRKYPVYRKMLHVLRVDVSRKRRSAMRSLSKTLKRIRRRQTLRYRKRVRNVNARNRALIKRFSSISYRVRKELC